MTPTICRTRRDFASAVSGNRPGEGEPSPDAPSQPWRGESGRTNVPARRHRGGTDAISPGGALT